MLYKYSGFDKQGKKLSGTIESPNGADATTKLRNRQIFVQSIKEQKPSFFTNFSLRKKEAIKTKALAGLSRDLAIYINAGISIVNGIRIATNQYSNDKKMSAFLNSLATYLDEGKSFSGALEAQEVYALPFFFRQSIKVSEDGGILADVLTELSKFLKNQDKMGKQVKSALTYPGFILIFAIIMISVMMIVVVPEITAIFEQMDKELPGITQFTIDLSDFLIAYWHLLLVGFILFISGFKLALSLNPKLKYLFHRFMLKLPLFGVMIETSELGRFSYMISMLLRSGVPFVQGITLSAKIVDNVVIAQIFNNASVKVVEGGKLSTALANESYQMDKSFIQAIALGEETSELEKILTNLSELYAEDNEDRVKGFLGLLEPIMMVFVGGSVGFIVASMLLPIFSMNI